MHLALFASSHLTAFLLHTDCAYVVSYSCRIFLSDKATWRLLTRTQSAKLTVKSIAFSIGVSDEDFELLKSAIGDGHGDNDATTNGKRRNGRTMLGHTLQLGWEYYSIAKIVDIAWWKYCRRSEGGCYAAPARENPQPAVKLCGSRWVIREVVDDCRCPCDCYCLALSTSVCVILNLANQPLGLWPPPTRDIFTSAAAVTPAFTAAADCARAARRPESKTDLSRLNRAGWSCLRWSRQWEQLVGLPRDSVMSRS